LSVKTPFSNLGLTPTKWWWNFHDTPFDAQNPLPTEVLPSQPEQNFLFPDESSGSFQETAGIFEIRHVLNTYI